MTGEEEARRDIVTVEEQARGKEGKVFSGREGERNLKCTDSSTWVLTGGKGRDGDEATVTREEEARREEEKLLSGRKEDGNLKCGRERISEQVTMDGCVTYLPTLSTSPPRQSPVHS